MLRLARSPPLGAFPCEGEEKGKRKGRPKSRDTYGSRAAQSTGLALASGGGRAFALRRGSKGTEGRRREGHGRSASSSCVKSGTHMAGWRGESASWEPPRRCRGTGQGSEGTAGIREARGGWWTVSGPGWGARFLVSIPAPGKGRPRRRNEWAMSPRGWLGGAPEDTAVQRRRMPWKRAHVLTSPSAP
jgi:hypothetical protein